MQAIPQRIQLSRARGFRLQEVSRALNGLPAVSVARPSYFGNPFPVDVYGREGAVDRFRRLMCGPMSAQEMHESSHWGDLSPVLVRNRIRAALPKLRGHNLACWCPLPEPGAPDCCHAGVLLELAR